MMDTTYISGLKTKPLITQIAVIFKILNYLYHLKAQLMSCFTTEHHKCTYIHRYMFVSMYVGTCSWSVHELTTDHALTYLITCGITICKYDWVIFSRMDPFQYKHVYPMITEMIFFVFMYFRRKSNHDIWCHLHLYIHVYILWKNVKYCHYLSPVFLWNSGNLMTIICTN
jgi:hypothetical protein